MSESARPASAAILTLGCKLNIADSEAMARRLREHGLLVTDKPDGAEAVVINTCSVTHVADQKSRHLVRAARRAAAPDAIVALTGCLIETASPQTIEALNADLVYRQPDQAALADRIIALRPGFAASEQAAPARLKTRAFIAAQEGCNDVCAFCIIPRTRGRERSKSIRAVIAEARAREAEGVQEIVITGTQLGAYGRDRGEAGPAALLRALLNETSAPRIRMSSLQPQDLSAELVALWRNPQLCRHFHLALQSGSESVLQRMRRRYTADDYAGAVERLRDAIPGVAITTDVIAGFPGESDAEFEQGYRFCETMAFAGMHVFPYSQRSGTLAFKMPGQVSDSTKKERVRRLIDLADSMATVYRKRSLGSSAAVLWEKAHDGVWEGLTDTYLRVRARSNDDLANRITPTRLMALDGNTIWGEVIP